MIYFVLYLFYEFSSGCLVWFLYRFMFVIVCLLDSRGDLVSFE